MRSGTSGGKKKKKKNTHRNRYTVISLKLRDVLVSPGHLRSVERPETAHHLDAGLRCVRHVRRCGWMERCVLQSNSPPAAGERSRPRPSHGAFSWHRNPRTWTWLTQHLNFRWGWIRPDQLCLQNPIKSLNRFAIDFLNINLHYLFIYLFFSTTNDFDENTVSLLKNTRGHHVSCNTKIKIKDEVELEGKDSHKGLLWSSE